MFVTPVMQRPEKDSLKSKVRHMARLQHLSVSAPTACAQFRDQLVAGVHVSMLLCRTVV